MVQIQQFQRELILSQRLFAVQAEEKMLFVRSTSDNCVLSAWGGVPNAKLDSVKISWKQPAAAAAGRATYFFHLCNVLAS